MSTASKNKVTSPAVAKKAAVKLADSKTPKPLRPPIASALAQAAGKPKAKKK